jgi:hypothetical protein
MNVISILYVLYFLISIAIIHLMARTLARSSGTFLREALPGKSGLVLLLDRVLIASFFLANVGFVLADAPLRYPDHPGAREAIVTLLEKLGATMLFVGFTMFLGLWIFTRMRRLRQPASVTR